MERKLNKDYLLNSLDTWAQLYQMYKRYSYSQECLEFVIGHLYCLSNILEECCGIIVDIRVLRKTGDIVVNKRRF